jgi:hypothetical protein
MPWMSPLSLQAWDGINQCERLLRIVTVGSGQLNSKRNPRDRRRSDDVCCPACPGRLDSVPSAAPKNCPDRTAVHDGPRPINLPAALQPVQQGEVDQLPDARLLPVA